MILKKYSDTFTDADVIELGNLFYVGKGGDSVSHERHVIQTHIILMHRHFYIKIDVSHI